ncbi:MAG: hypothetical protein N4A47_00775 [Clostridia bacterium]|nr:hypothetical protein [Clostridia bacterium]
MGKDLILRGVANAALFVAKAKGYDKFNVKLEEKDNLNPQDSRVSLDSSGDDSIEYDVSTESNAAHCFDCYDYYAELLSDTGINSEMSDGEIKERVSEKVPVSWGDMILIGSGVEKTMKNMEKNNNVSIPKEIVSDVTYDIAKGIKAMGLGDSSEFTLLSSDKQDEIVESSLENISYKVN